MQLITLRLPPQALGYLTRLECFRFRLNLNASDRRPLKNRSVFESVGHVLSTALRPKIRLSL